MPRFLSAVVWARRQAATRRGLFARLRLGGASAGKPSWRLQNIPLDSFFQMIFGNIQLSIFCVITLSLFSKSNLENDTT
ncbi:MAG: hypothetical protein OXH76_09475 [Boseongicola sp.]|nr:hypothetical protein [Boseongicola sp.]